MDSFKNKLYNILDDFRRFTSREDTFKRCTTFKFNRNMNEYDNNVNKITQYLLSRSSIKVLKTIQRERAKEDLKRRKMEMEDE